MVQNKKSSKKGSPKRQPPATKPGRTRTWLIIACLMVLAGAVVWRVYFAGQPSFCYVDSGQLACTDTDGQHFRQYQLPQVGGHEITGLLPAPGQSRYAAISTNITGLDDHTPTIWLLRQDLSAEKQIDLPDYHNDGTTYGRLFAVWSPDGQNLLIRSSRGTDYLYNYHIATGKLTQLGDYFSEGLGVGYYGFAGSARIVVVSGTDSAWSKVTTFKPDGTDQ